MSKKRRRFSSAFKLKVILEALKERDTLSELAQKYELHQNQISTWKNDFLSQANEYMSHKGSGVKKKKEVETEQLYAKIGQLQTELDYLKKKLC